MKKFFLEFARRGVIVFGFGPIVLAVLYLILQKLAVIESLSATEVCIGIFSLSVLAFIAGGMNAIYQIERLPLMTAVLIHGLVLYVCYLLTYLLNGWLQQGAAPILVFSGVFVVGYFAIWAIIYAIIKKKTQRLNEQLQQKQQKAKVNQNS